MDTKTRHIISRLKETAGKILPASAKLWLYGSRARGEAKEEWNRFLSTPFRQNVITDKIALQ